MSLDLDTRQRAMLAEMGVRVWLPAPEVQVAHVPQVAPAPQSRDQSEARGSVRANAPLAARAGGALAPTQDLTPKAAAWPPADASDAMDWPALAAAVGACQACAMCQGRRAPVLVAPAQASASDWLILGEPPDESQERAGAPFVGDAGVLLDNMLKAVGVFRQGSDAATSPQASAYLSLVLKCRPALPTAPDAQALQTCARFLRREIALVQPKVIVAMGRQAMQLLLSEDHPQGLKLPLGKLRGQVWHFQGVPVVVTYPPAYLLRNGQDKARAWEDLCLAADVAEGEYTPI